MEINGTDNKWILNSETTKIKIEELIYEYEVKICQLANLITYYESENLIRNHLHLKKEIDIYLEIIEQLKTIII
jgi:hypothetical protein